MMVWVYTSTNKCDKVWFTLSVIRFGLHWSVMTHDVILKAEHCPIPSNRTLWYSCRAQKLYTVLHAWAAYTGWCWPCWGVWHPCSFRALEFECASYIYILKYIYTCIYISTYHIIWCHFMSCHLISYHIISCVEKIPRETMSLPLFDTIHICACVYICIYIYICMYMCMFIYIYMFIYCT